MRRFLPGLLWILALIYQLRCVPAFIVVCVNGNRDGCMTAILLIYIVARYAKQPRLKFCVVLQGPQLLIHGHKCLLSQIFRFFFRGHHSVDEVQHLARKQVIDLLKSSDLTCLGLVDKPSQERRVCRDTFGVQVLCRQSELINKGFNLFAKVS